MSPAFLVNYVYTLPEDDKLKTSKSIQDGCLEYFFRNKIIYRETIRECLCLYAPRACMLFVNEADENATTCAFLRGCCEVNGTAISAVCAGLPHLRKYD